MAKELCSMKEVAARLHGEISNDIDPLAEPKVKLDDWGEYLHEQEGGVISLAARIGKSVGINTNTEDGLKGILASGNPLMDKLKGGENPNTLQQGIFDFLAPMNSVAKPVLNEYIKARTDFENYINQDKSASMDVYQDQVATRATDLLKKVKAEPGKYGIDKGNVHMTTRFLQQVENGWPFADYAHEASERTAHLENGLVKGAKAAASNLMKSHVTLSPMIYLFHAGQTPIRLFSEYKLNALKILPDVFHRPGILLGEKIPEAESMGIYSKALDSANPKNWSKSDWKKGLTGIPQTQTFNESLAYLLSKHGVPIDEALQRIALIDRDPLNMPMFMTAPDRGGSVSGLSYMRYVMFQHAAYLNMFKRAFTGSATERANALGSIALYTGINYALYGKDAAIPGSGLIKSFEAHGTDGSTLEDPEEESPGGNAVYRTTGLDLGEAMSPLSFFDLYHSVKMIDNTGKGISSDIKALQKDTSTIVKGAALAHMALLGSELFNFGGFSTPDSVTKAVKTYGKSIDKTADNPLDVNWDEFWDNEIKANLGTRVAKKFKDHNQ